VTIYYLIGFAAPILEKDNYKFTITRFFFMFDIINVNPFEHRTSTRTRTFSYTEDGLKESRNVCKYR